MIPLVHQNLTARRVKNNYPTGRCNGGSYERTSPYGLRIERTSSISISRTSFVSKEPCFLGCVYKQTESNMMNAPAVNKGHVYFGSEDRIPRDNSIVVKQNSPGHIQIHLGFLQYHHIYSLSVEIPKSYFSGHDIHTVLEAAENSAPNLNCKLLSIEEKRDFYEFLVEFHAEKERLLKEEVKLDLDEELKVKLEFNARVLGPGKGTPLLKNGIKCIGVVSDDTSEASDWQG